MADAKVLPLDRRSLQLVISEQAQQAAQHSNPRVLGDTPEAPNSGLDIGRISSALPYNDQIKFNAHAVPISSENNAPKCILGKNLKQETVNGQTISVEAQLKELLKNVDSGTGPINIVQFTSRRSLNHGSAAHDSRESKFPPLSAKLNLNTPGASQRTENLDGTPPFIKYELKLNGRTINLIEIAPDFHGGIMSEKSIQETVDTLGGLNLNQSNIHCMLSPGGIGRPSIIHAALQLKTKANENNNTNDTVNEVVKNIEKLRPQYISVKRSASTSQQTNLEGYFKIEKNSQTKNTELSQQSAQLEINPEKFIRAKPASSENGPQSPKPQSFGGMQAYTPAGQGTHQGEHIRPNSTQPPHVHHPLPATRSFSDPVPQISTTTPINNHLNEENLKNINTILNENFGIRYGQIEKKINLEKKLYDAQKIKIPDSTHIITIRHNMCWLHSSFASIYLRFREDKKGFIDLFINKLPSCVPEEKKQALKQNLEKIFAYHKDNNNNNHDEIATLQFPWIVIASCALIKIDSSEHLLKSVLPESSNAENNSELTNDIDSPELSPQNKSALINTYFNDLLSRIAKPINNNDTGECESYMFGFLLHTFLEQPWYLKHDSLILSNNESQANPHSTPLSIIELNANHFNVKYSKLAP